MNVFDNLRTMQQRYNGLIGELRELQKESSVPDATKVANIETEIRSLSAQIAAERLIVSREYGVDPERRYTGIPVGGDSPAGADEGREEVLAYLRAGVNLRGMTSGKTGGADTGGYLIPQSWENQIIERERELFVMRQLADVQTSESDRNIPIADDLGASEWIKEGAAYPESGAEFSMKILHAYKVGRICKVSEELLMDNTYNLEQWLVNTFAYTNGLAMEDAYFYGDGNDKPSGFMNDADPVPAAGPVLSYNDFLAVFADLKEQYYRSAVWLMNRLTLIETMKLKDDAGNFLYKPFETRKESDPLGHILGKPVVLSEFMPNIAAGNKPIAFGDFKRYRIHDRVGFLLQRLNELYAENGFVGFRGMQRTDGKLLIPEAIKVLEF